MNKVYSELSEELLRRVINKNTDLVTRDLNISNYNNFTRHNYVYPSSSSKGSNLTSITTDITSLHGYTYVGNKAGFIPMSVNDNTQRYIHPSTHTGQSIILIKEPIGNKPVVVNEFMRRSDNHITYLYTQVGEVNSYTPLLKTWTYNSTFSLVDNYPSEMYLFPSNALDWEVIWTMGVSNMFHPFLPYFLFTGLVVCVGQYRNIMYEYTDTEGLYGSKYDVYLSSLRPFELDYPLGFPRQGMLERDICYRSLIGEYPYEGILDRDLGGYTGLVTTSLYHPIHKFYLYIRSDYSLFLSSRHPQQGAKQFVLGKRTELNLVRDPFELPVVTVPSLVEINDGIIKEYIYEYKLHEL
jgi:hypothetical protein